MTTANRTSIGGLIFWPAVISLAVTILRLTRELEHWSPRFFARGAGGPGAIVGITWLAPVFGIYFALRLAKLGEGPGSLLGALGFAILGTSVMLSFGLVAQAIFREPPTFQARLTFGFILCAVAGVATLAGWPKLWKMLLAYGFAARLPVIIIMFLAFQGHWGTHYDATPPDYPVGMGLVATWVWLGLIPQLVVWIGFTLVSGMLFGSVAEALRRLMGRLRAAPQPVA